MVWFGCVMVWFGFVLVWGCGLGVVWVCLGREGGGGGAEEGAFGSVLWGRGGGGRGGRGGVCCAFRLSLYQFKRKPLRLDVIVMFSVIFYFWTSQAYISILSYSFSVSSF